LLASWKTPILTPADRLGPRFLLISRNSVNVIRLKNTSLSILGYLNTVYCLLLK